MKPFQYNAKVVRVIDGDSIVVDIDLGFWINLKNQNIRLKNIDAPEFRTTDDIEKKFGTLTKAIVESFLPAGKTILLETDLSDHDKFGRILGTVVIETANGAFNLNEFLLENHYAVPYEGQNKDQIADAHQQNRIRLIESGQITID
jgi:micrococcal nuclease